MFKMIPTFYTLHPKCIFFIMIGIFGIGNGLLIAQNPILNGKATQIYASPASIFIQTNTAQAPVIQGDTNDAFPFLNITTNGPSAISMDLNDPTDRAHGHGILFQLSDADSPVSSLIFSAKSDNQNVVPDGNLILSGSNAGRLLKINAIAAGYANIVLTASDPEGQTDTYTLQLAVSNTTIFPNSTRFLVGSSDGSTAIVVDSNYMWVGDDENQTIRLYQRGLSSLPVYEMNFNTALGSSVEADIEASFQQGDTIYWMGSHTSASRSVIFSTLQSGTGKQATLTFLGQYHDLRQDLINWDNNNGHGLGAGYLGLANLEVEGLSADPNHPEGALVAFRGPLVNGKALIVPVLNFQTIVKTAPSPNSAVFGAPMLLNLGGRSLRSIECNNFGCLLIGGPVGNVDDFRLFTWTGNAADLPALRSANLTAQTNACSFEGIVGIPSQPFLGSAGDTVQVQFILDSGTFDFYQDGTEAKNLPHPEWKKCRSEWVKLGTAVNPPVANPGDLVIHEIMQNPGAVLDTNGEWFEIFNASSQEIDLNNWTLRDLGTDSTVLHSPNPLLIAPGGFIILGAKTDLAINGGIPVNYAWNNFTLGNDQDEIILIAPDGLEIDRVEWDGGPNFPDPNGASMALKNTSLDNNVGANWCTATTPLASGDFGTPGTANDCLSATAAHFIITEIWSGQAGTDLTPDWFEIKNTGTQAWISGVDPNLYYDDDSADPVASDLIQGIDTIPAGAYAIVLVTPSATDIATFKNIWSPVIDLTGVPFGYTDGAGLSGGGDAVTLWLGDPATSSPIDFKNYPDTAPFDGQSFDIELNTFSVVGNANGAVKTIALGGTSTNVPNIGSPGNKGPIVGLQDLSRNTEYRVFPNPSEGSFFLQSLGGTPLLSVRVFDGMGNLILTRQVEYAEQVTIDLNTQKPGNYTLQVFGEWGYAAFSLVKI
jgi:hypothetical protein